MKRLCQAFTLYSTSVGTTIADLASDGTAVIWSDPSNSMINYVSGKGGSLVTIGTFANGVDNPGNLTFAASIVDWMQFSLGGGVSYLGAADPGVAGSGMLYTENAASGQTRGLVSDGEGEYVYMLYDDDGYVNVLREPSNGSNEFFYIYQETSTQGGSNLAVDAAPNYVVFGDIGNSQVIVYDVNTDTGSGVSGYPDAYWVATDGTNAYWGATVAGKYPILSAPLATPTSVTPLLADTGAAITGIATDGKSVFFIANHVVEYVPVAGASTATTLSNVANPEHLKAAGKGVFFDDGQKIWEVAAPAAP